MSAADCDEDGRKDCYPQIQALHEAASCVLRQLQMPVLFSSSIGK